MKQIGLVRNSIEIENEVILPGNYSLVEDLKPNKIKESDPLWNSLKAGSYAAFEKIFRSYYPSLLSYGLRFNKDDEEIKDCIQIMFLNIWERKEFLGNSDSIRSYLLASLRRLILKRMRSTISFVELDFDDSNFHIELSVESQIIHDQTLRENVIFLQNAIQNLPDRQKEALYLKFYNDRSFADIAAIMNITTRAVYKLIYKALDSLNEELAPQTKNVPFVLSMFLSLIYSASDYVNTEISPLSLFID